MIYKSDVNAINESEYEALLESVEDRFEFDTMAEATAIVVGEQEANWTMFMKSVGLSELAAFSEGQEVVYEGSRLEGFIKTTEAFFEKIKQKIAELTKAFMAKVDSMIGQNNIFLKQYEKAIRKASIPANFEYKGYTFKNMEGPDYSNDAVKSVSDVKDGVDLSKEAAHKALFKGTTPSGDNLNAMIKDYFYGEKEKKVLSIDVDEQIKIMKETAGMKKQAWSTYIKAAKEISKIIKELKASKKEFNKEHKKDESDETKNVQDAFKKLISYWRAYANGALVLHGGYLTALGARNRQAMSICAKIVAMDKAAAVKAKVKKEKEEPEVKTEGFVNTEAFLGAVDFI